MNLPSHPLGRAQKPRQIVRQPQRGTRCAGPQSLKSRLHRRQIVRLQPRQDEGLNRLVELALLQLDMPGVAGGEGPHQGGKERPPQRLPFQQGC